VLHERQVRPAGRTVFNTPTAPDTLPSSRQAIPQTDGRSPAPKGWPPVATPAAPHHTAVIASTHVAKGAKPSNCLRQRFLWETFAAVPQVAKGIRPWSACCLNLPFVVE
jgi:hypothetical protein